MKPFFCFVVTALLLSAASLGVRAQQPPGAQAARGGGPQAGPPVRTITQVRGDLYKVQSGAGVAAVTVFLVTPDGIVLADPLNPEFAAWLKGELATRFPGRPVKYVLESHYHWDHARGGAMFADTAKFVGHANMPKNLDLPIRQARPPGDTDDLDGDNRLTREEAQTGTRAQFDRMNGNGDGFLDHDEINADIRRPDITFADRYTVTLGGKRVELIWSKNRHTSDLFDIYFPDERVLFASDYVWIKRLCCNFSFDRRPISTWVASIRALEALDFDTVINSHWESGSKTDLVAFRQYLEELATQVQAGIAAGKSVDELKRTVTLDAGKYKDWSGFPDQLPAMVESAYTSLTKFK